jgi:hypothetical protein
MNFFSRNDQTSSDANGQIASATVASDLIPARGRNAGVTQETVDRLAEAGFSGELVALAKDLAEQESGAPDAQAKTS